MGEQLDIVRFGGADVPIGPAGVVIGRDSGCDIVIDAATVSRQHARIYNDAKGCWVADLGTRNGTRVNGLRLDGKPAGLSNGDRVRIGDEEVVVLTGEKTAFADPRIAGRPRTGSSRATSMQLAAKPITIGRDPANTLTLDDPNVSRFHAVIEPRSRGVLVRDLSSRNGTRVNGTPVSSAWLTPGDQIAIGAFRFRFTGSTLDPVQERGKLRLESREVSISAGNKLLLAPTSLKIEPGELVAIIGESGAGKTTLLKALAGVTPPTAGQVLVNGEPVETRLTDIGYVPQDDIVHRLLTVREALRYAAKLRLPPDTTAREVDAAVQRVLGELDLSEPADVRVDRISGGERKRVGVAVELLSRPGILLLDEPASGLDPGLEKKLMALLWKLSRDGRPVITITHSTKYLPRCDQLIVMGRGGVLCYYGPPPGALRFFGVADFDDIYQALSSQPVEHWSRRRPREVAPPPRSAPSMVLAVPGARERQPAALPQALVLARRYLTLMLRDHRNLAILLGQVPVLALAIVIGFAASTFARPGPLINAPTFLFITTIVAVWLGAFAAAREIVKEKSVFLRERAVGVSVRAYLLSKTLVLFLLCAVQTFILIAILFGLRPLHASNAAYLEAGAILLITSLAAIGIGMLISTLARSEDQAMSYIPLFLIPQLLFGGSIIPLLGKGIAFKVLAGAMLARWAFAGLGAATSIARSPIVIQRYGSLFSLAVPLLIIVVAIFALVALALVGARLATQRD